MILRPVGKAGGAHRSNPLPASLFHAAVNFVIFCIVYGTPSKLRMIVIDAANNKWGGELF